MTDPKEEERTRERGDSDDLIHSSFAWDAKGNPVLPPCEFVDAGVATGEGYRDPDQVVRES